MNRSAQLASAGLRSPSRPLRGARLWKGVSVALFVCALACLISAPSVAWSQAANELRIAIQSDSDKVGEVLLSTNADGDLELVGLVGAVPNGSQVSFSRESFILIPVGSPTTVTATPPGGFPGAGEGNAVTFDTTTLARGAIFLVIVTPQGETIKGSVPFALDANGLLTSTAAIDGVARKVKIVAVDAGNDALVGEMLLTQREVSGLIADVFEGLPGAVPPLSVVTVTHDNFRPSPDRIVEDIVLGTFDSGYTVAGDPGPTSNGYLEQIVLGDQNNGNIARDGVAGTLDGVLTLSILQAGSATPFIATVQNDVAAELTLDAIVDGVNNNNVAAASDPFPLTDAVGIFSGSVDAGEAEGGFVVAGLETGILDTADIQADGTFSLTLTGAGTPAVPVSSIDVVYTDLFGNTLTQSLALDTAANLYQTAVDSAVLDIVGTVTGRAEPGSSVSVTGQIFGGVDMGAPTHIETVVADNAGDFTVDVPASPTVILTVADRAGNTTSQTVDVDIVADLSGVTVDNTASGIAGTVTGQAEPNASISAYAQVFGGVDMGVSTLVDTVAAANDGSFSIDIPASPTVTLTVVDLAGNSTSQAQDIDTVAVDPAITVSSIAAVRTGSGIAYTLDGVAEADAQIRVIGAAFDFTPLDPAIPTNTSSADLPDNGRIYYDRADPSATAADGAFTVTFNGALGETVFLRTVDIAGNLSNYVALALDLLPGNIDVAATITNYSRGSSDLLTVTVTDTTSNTPLDNLFVNLFADSNLTLPLIDLNFWMTGFHGAGTVIIDVPEYLVGSDITDSSTFIDGGVIVVSDAFGTQLARIDIPATLDRTGPTIGFTILPDVDLQLVERGNGSVDVLNILNILPAASNALTSIPADAVPFAAILADGDADGAIDVNSTDIVVVAIAPFNSLMASQYGLTFDISGVSNIQLGDNSWNASTQTVDGYEEVFVALFDTNYNFAVDPIPLRLDTRIDDPAADSITVTMTSVTGAAGAAEAGGSVSLYANASLSDYLGSAQVDDTGAFVVTYSRDSVDELFLVATDAAGNRSNPLNLKAISSQLQYVIADGLGLFHTSTDTLSADARETDIIRAIAPHVDSNGAFYLLDGFGNVSDYRLQSSQAAASPLPAIADLGLSADLARDIEVTSISDSASSGYILLGQGFVVPFGDAPFFGDILDSDAERSRVLLDGTRVLLDENGNGEADIFINEDVNGNGILDVEVVPTDDGGFELVTEDTNGNGVLDSDVEDVVDMSDVHVGFNFDVARDLEVVRDVDGNIVGYVMLDGFGTLHTFGETDIELDNTRVNFNYAYQALELVADGANNIVDFIAVDGEGQIVGLPDGRLGAAPLETEGVPRGDAGDLSGALNIDLPYFGFNILRDIEANPVDLSGNGLTGDGTDGFYVLDGYGGVHAIGGAAPLSNTIFLGFDIARDLEFVSF